MNIQTGYLYHIKDEFFDIVDDDNLMINHERRNFAKVRIFINLLI